MTPYEKLEALYAQLPKVNCKQKCQYCCGPLLIPKIEERRLRERRGFLRTESGVLGAKRTDLPPPEVVKKEFIGILPDDNNPPLHCVFLNLQFGTCMAYRIRPLVCRIWGTIDHPLMRCKFGCVPERWLTLEEHKQVLLRIIEIQKEAGL